MNMFGAIRNYGLVTAAYWGLTITDGALRMLVLLHFNALGFSPYDIGLLFILYEVAGVLTNMFGGWLATVLGLRFTLYAGLALQIVSLFALSQTNPAWAPIISVVFVMCLQALSGVAKDLTKMSSKSAIRLLVSNDAQGTLFRWVALLTGSKNTLKGAGFFIGGVLLEVLGFERTLIAMAVSLLIILAIVSVSLGRADLGRQGATKPPFREIFSQDRNINILSAARIFLFGARDIWFVVGLPVFLSEMLGWPHTEVGAYMACWVVGYGIVQAITPRLIAQKHINGLGARLWLLVLCITTILILAAIMVGISPRIAVLGGLIVFGIVFAINSSLHSYLVLAFAKNDKVAMNVGFYYMSNAIGRLAGTVLSGLAYQFGGLTGCLVLSALFLVTGWLISFGLPAKRIELS